MFGLCQSAVLWSTTVVIEVGGIYFSLVPYAYALMLVPYLPYVFACMISVNKKVKFNDKIWPKENQPPQQ